MKLQALSQLPDLVKGKRVVLAEGTFDVLHVGDLRYLKQARLQGEVLVVAVRSDKSCRETAPILPEGERAALVAGLGCVDYVVLFDEPDASHVIEILQPAIRARRAEDAGDGSTAGIIGRILQKASQS